MNMMARDPQGDLTPEDLDKLKGLADVIDAFAEKDKNMPLQMIRTYLLVAIEEGKHGTLSIAQSLDLADTVAARHVADLGEMDRSKEEGTGHDLVMQKINPRDRRYRKAWLTPKGRAFRAKLIRDLRKGDR